MLRLAVLAVAMPLAAVGLTLAVGADPHDALPALALLCLVWGLFLLQAFSGRTARAWLAHQRLRQYLLPGRRARPQGERRSLPGPARPSASPPRAGGSRPRLAWSHDGWANAEGNLVGLDLLAERFDIVAFGTDSRQSGEPPVPLELLRELRYDEGIMLEGLTERLGAFDVAWLGASYEGTTQQALEAKAAGGPALVCAEWENVPANYGYLHHPVRARSLREVDHFCAGSVTAKAMLELDGVDPDRATVVPLVTEMPEYGAEQRAALRSEGRARWQLEMEDTVLLFMGRTVWEKGLHTIAAAVATLAQRPDAGRTRWLIAGDGDYLAEFRRIVTHYGASGSVRVAGALAGRDRHLAYAAADALVLPSLPTPRWLEQFGRVIPEGFAFGLPVLGSASGAIPEVVGDAGVIFAPGDHLALAAAAQRVGHAAELARLRTLALRRASAEYSVERYVERVTDAVGRALARHSRPPR